MLSHLIVAIIIGGLSGWVASMIMKTNNSIVKNIVLGIAGGFILDLLLELIGITIAGYLGVVVVSIIGAMLLIFIINKYFK